MNSSLLRCVLVLLSCGLPAHGAFAAATPYSLVHSLFNPGSSAQPGSRQGTSVAMDGNFVAVGAPYDDLGATDSGVVNIYRAGTGALLHSLTNPRPAHRDLFGAAVAVSGPLVVVGASEDEAGVASAGSAFVYDLAGATPSVPVLTLTNPSPASYVDFGLAVAVSDTRVVVGARYDDTGATGTGRAFVFDLASATPTVPAFMLNNPTPSLYEGFGNAVAIAGTRVVVSAMWDDSVFYAAGSVYVYELAGPTPNVPALTLNNPFPWGSYNFGQSLALSGARLVVGVRNDQDAFFDSGTAYVYDLAGALPLEPVQTLLNPVPEDYARFGVSVAISGTRLIVGAMGANADGVPAGCAYLYDLANPLPTEPLATLTNSTPEYDDRLGFAVAISGTRAVAGTPLDDSAAADAGSAYLYDVAGTRPSVPIATFINRSPTLGDAFGWSVAISGTRLVVGTPQDDTGAANAGSASVYELAGAAPAVPVVTLVNPTPGAEDQFGTAVAISGTLAVVGAPLEDTGQGGAGSVYLYDLADSSPGAPVMTLNSPSPTTNGYFGFAVAVADRRVVIGAPYQAVGGTTPGRVYVYDLDSTAPNIPAFVLSHPNPASGTGFGYAVAISGSRVVVGAPFDSTVLSTAGAAYVFDLSHATPGVPVLTLNNPAPGSGDGFGFAVAISGTRLVTGAPWDTAVAQKAGSAYVYELTSGTPAAPVLTLHNPAPDSHEFFGNAVAMSGTLLVVGTSQDSAVATAAGSAYVYDLANATPAVPASVLSKPAPVAHDHFGAVLAMQGTTVVAGTPLDDTTGADRGAVYVFGLIPSLSIEPDDAGFIRLTWTPAEAPGFVLQYTDSFAPAHWLTAPSGATNPISIPATNAARFYRVAQP